MLFGEERFENLKDEFLVPLERARRDEFNGAGIDGRFVASREKLAKNLIPDARRS